MSSDKWAKYDQVLNNYEDLVDYKYDAFAPENCIYSPSPYFNWILSNSSGGIPKGTGVLFFSEPKAGKSLMIQAIVAELHKRDPEARAIIFNSEMRGFVQQGFFEGIDPKRLKIYDTSRPEEIFDRIEKDILPMIQDGYPLGLVAFDSITMIGGVKAADKGIQDHLIGDKALTIAKGWEKVIPIFKKYKIPYIGVEQMRMNIDPSNPRAPKTKMAGTFMTKHVFEYFVSIKRAGAAEDKMDLDGVAYEDTSSKDARGNKSLTGHKIFFKLEESSLGTPGRAGVLTLDYKKGIINTHEEVALLGIGTGIIKSASPTGGGAHWMVGDMKLHGKKQVAHYLKENPDVQAKILEEVSKLDAKKAD